MKKILIFGILLLALGACRSKKELTNNNERINRYFPELLGDLVFNLSLDEVIAKRPNLAPVNYVNDAFSFRKEFVEEINEAGIKKLVYYFSVNDQKPFYELIIIYENDKIRDKEALRLLGQPNFENNTEWIIGSRQDYKIKAWKFENNLVLAAQLKGTEWEE
jgi:hypothetical protein